MTKIPKGYYAIIFKERKSQTYGVHFPDFSGVITFGSTFEEASEMAREALAVSLESDFDRHLSLPKSHKPKVKKGEKKIFIPLEPEIRTAYLLREWREREGLSQKQLAQRLAISFQAYQRMERPGRSNLTISTLQRIASALNKELVLDVIEA